MEIYIIYRAFVSIFATVRGLEQVDGKMLFTALGIGGGIWLVLFVLQGFGLYAMAKKREMKNKWLVFVPFASVWYMGKLAGSCDVFGKKMKRPGLYTMISQVLTVLVCSAAIAVEILLFTKYGTEEYKVIGEYGVQWSNLPPAGRYAFNFYVISDYIISIVELVYLVLLFILLMGLYKKYYTRGYMLLSFLALFIPMSRYIAIFVIRNNKAIDYEAYMRARREEFIRCQQQQQNPYGRPPYNQGPYNQGPYNQGPYNQSPYGQNPYQPPYGGQQGTPPPQEDPFSEFSSKGSGTPKQSEENRENASGEDTKKSGGSSDDLFG